MARTSQVGYFRQYGSTKAATPSVGVQCIQFTQDSAVASADTGKVLPKGAIPIWVSNLDGGGAGTNATIDVGVSGTAAGLADELPNDAVSAPVVTGSLLGTPLTVDTAIYAGTGGTAGTGDVLVGVYYIMQDDGKA